MKVEISRSNRVPVCDTMELVGGRWKGYVNTPHGTVSVYGQANWAYFRLTIDEREYKATVDAPGPANRDRLRRLAGRFARTVATLAAGSPEGNGPYTMTLAR